MEIGLIIRYGKLVPGREHQAIELFQEATTYFTRKREAGELTWFEPFFFQTSDLDEELGFYIAKGSAPQVFALIEEEAYRTLMQKAMTLVEHVRMDFLTVGDGIPAQVELSMKVLAELGV